MGIGLDRHVAHPANRLADSRIAAKVDAHHQSIRKKPISGSSSVRVRPAIGTPIGKSS